MENSKKKILVVEDESSLRDMFVMVLQDEDYQVDAAADGSEAWKLLSSNHYDLLATDLYMPVMNGIDLILACQESFPNIKTILFSGGGRDFDAENGQDHVTFNGREIKVNIFLKKPCDLNDLLSTVEILLQN